MPVMTKLGNKTGDTVELPEEVAKQLFGRLGEVDEVLAAANKDDVEDVEEPQAAPALAVAPGESAPDENLSLDSLDCPKEALEVIRDYALLPSDQRTVIQKPLSDSLGNIITKHELELVETAAKKQYLTPLLETSLYLRFNALSDLCAAFAYERIRKIDAEAPDIMAGAEAIRKFLNIPNEWTEEEMGHLQKEMEFVASLEK